MFEILISQKCRSLHRGSMSGFWSSNRWEMDSKI